MLLVLLSAAAVVPPARLATALDVDHDAVGHLDGLEVDRGWVRASGWAGDADAHANGRAVRIYVYVDGRLAQTILPWRLRPDVSAVFAHIGDQSGFNDPLELSKGAHSVCLWAVNQGPGSSALLGCGEVTQPNDNGPTPRLDPPPGDGSPPALAPPRPDDVWGSLDGVMYQFPKGYDGQTHARGCAADPNLGPISGIEITIFVDDKVAANTTTHVTRPETEASRVRFTE